MQIRRPGKQGIGGIAAAAAILLVGLGFVLLLSTVGPLRGLTDASNSQQHGALKSTEKVAPAKTCPPPVKCQCDDDSSTSAAAGVQAGAQTGADGKAGARAAAAGSGSAEVEEEEGEAAGAEQGAGAAIEQAAGAAGSGAEPAAAAAAPAPAPAPALAEKCKPTPGSGSSSSAQPGKPSSSGGSGSSRDPGAASGDPGAATGGWQSSPHVSPAAGPAGYTPKLSARRLNKGVVSHGTSSRARRAVSKLLAGEEVSVAFVGGSITWGQGAKEGVSDYVSLVSQWLNQTFRDSAPRVKNSAIPGTPSSYMALCCNWHVPLDADLIVVEYNINDGDARGDTHIRRAHERLVRRLLAYEKRPAVIELVVYRPPEQFNFEQYGTTAPYRLFGDDELGVIAQYYHLPWLSTRSMMWELSMAPNPLPEHQWQAWMHDVAHPEELGHKYMADLVIHYLQQVAEDVWRHPVDTEDEEEAQEALPPPMYKGNYPTQANSCVMGEEFKALVTAHDPDFKFVNEGNVTKPKLGWVSTKPGSSMQFTINTTLVSKELPPGALPDNPQQQHATDKTVLAIAYLQSYEHMGQAEVTCVSGCACDPLLIDGHHEAHNSQTTMGMMVVSSADACVIQVAVLESTKSGEHKVKVMGVIVNDVSGWILDERGALQQMALSVQFSKESGTEFVLGGY